MSDAMIAPPPLWDAVLQQAPVHLFLFDAALICRYAAPAAGGFQGRPAPALLGRPAAEVLPPAPREVHEALQRAVTGERAASEVLRLPAGGSGHWQVLVRPVSEARQRLVCLCIAGEDATAEAELRELRAEVAALRQADEQRRRELRALHAALRAGLAPISGYAQLIARRPHALRGLTAAEAITSRMLPAIGRLTRTIDRLGETTRPAPRLRSQTCRR